MAGLDEFPDAGSESPAGLRRGDGRAQSHPRRTQPRDHAARREQCVRRLRETLGDELVTRAGYGVVPTPYALSIWPSVREALANLRAAIAPVDFDAATTRDTFVLAMADATAVILIPACSRSWSRKLRARRFACAPHHPGSPSSSRGRGGADGRSAIFRLCLLRSRWARCRRTPPTPSAMRRSTADSTSASCAGITRLPSTADFAGRLLRSPPSAGELLRAARSVSWTKRWRRQAYRAASC